MDSTEAWRNLSCGIPSSLRLDDIFYSSVHKGSSVLVYGCGYGQTALDLQKEGYDVIAFDVNPMAIDVGRRRFKAYSRDRKYPSRVLFDIENGLKLPYEEDFFDAGVMEAYIGTFTDPEDRAKALEQASLVQKRHSILYLGVFALNEERMDRYERNLELTGEMGTFIVREGEEQDSRELYRVHHFTEPELRELLEPTFRIECLEHRTFMSRNGNPSPGFVVIARNYKSTASSSDTALVSP
ncbi:MAG: class I SAM-dependent methyltransferase [archaeon]